MTPDFGALLYRPVTAVFGRAVTYLSPNEEVSLPNLRGRVKRMAVALGPDAEDTGGITQMRDVLRIDVSQFPEGVVPEQGGVVTVDGERSVITDVLTDARGWHDLPLADAAP